MKKICIFTAILFIMFSLSCSKKSVAGDFSGKILMTVGNVLINGTAAVADSDVSADSTIITGKDSICEVVFNGKNILHILENSSIKLNMKSGQKGIKISSGGLEAVLKNLDQSKSSQPPFQVETSTAVAAVRGTTFYVRVLDGSNTAICACNGVVDLGNPGLANLKTVESRHHTGFIFNSGSKGLSFKEIKLKYKNEAELKKLVGHNDWDMEMLAAKIGVKIDWRHVDRAIR